MTGTALVPAAEEENGDDLKKFEAWRKKHFFRRPKRLLYEALDNDLHAFAAILVQRGTGKDWLYNEAHNGNTKRAANLIKAGADIHAEGGFSTPLQGACYRGNLLIAEMLIDAGCDIDRKGTGGYTPLMGAADAGNLEFINLLIEHGANPTLRDKEGRTALDWAVKSNRSSCIRTLQDYEKKWADEKNPKLLPAPLEKAAPAPEVPGPDGWSCTNDVVIRTVTDSASNTRIKNIFDFAARKMFTEIASNGQNAPLIMEKMSDVDPELLALAEQKRGMKPQTPGLL